MEDILSENVFQKRNIFYNLLCLFISENKKIYEGCNGILYWKTLFHFTALCHHLFMSGYSLTLDLDANDNDAIRDVKKFAPFFLTGWNIAFQVTFLLLALGYDYTEWTKQSTIKPAPRLQNSRDTFFAGLAFPTTIGYQTIFLTLSLFYDFLEWMNRSDGGFSSKMRYWRDIIFSSCVVPFTMFVSSMFWVLYAIDRELVYPRVFDDVVPWWFNHCVHTNIFLIVALETIVQPRTKPINRKIETTLCWTVSISYAIVYYSIYVFAHRWLYQVFGLMTWWQVCLFQLLAWSSTYFFYLIQFPMNRLFHSDEDINDKNLRNYKNQVNIQQEAYGMVKCVSHCGNRKVLNNHDLGLTKRIKLKI